MFASGIPVNLKSACGLSATYGCVSLIADSICALPLQIRTGPTIRNSTPLPLSRLLRQPYAEISDRDWLTQGIWALALMGNWFCRVIERDQLGYPLQLQPIANDSVQIHRNTGTGALEYRFYGTPVLLRDVFHVRYQSRPGEALGISPIRECALPFGTAMAKERYAESFFLNSANPQGVIQVPGYLDRAEARKMLRSWISAHQGLNAANSPAVLTDGAEWKPVSMNPSDSQLIESLNYSTAQIVGQIFRVPPHLVGVSSSDKGQTWGKGLEVGEREFHQMTLVGYCDTISRALTACHPRGSWVSFDSRAALRGSLLERAQAIAQLMNSGAITADDARAMLDLDDLPDGEGKIAYRPLNTLPVDSPISEPSPQGQPSQDLTGNPRLGRADDIAATIEQMTNGRH